MFFFHIFSWKGTLTDARDGDGGNILFLWQRTDSKAIYFKKYYLFCIFVYFVCFVYFLHFVYFVVLCCYCKYNTNKTIQYRIHDLTRQDNTIQRVDARKESCGRHAITKLPTASVSAWWGRQWGRWAGLGPILRRGFGASAPKPRRSFV